MTRELDIKVAEILGWTECATHGAESMGRPRTWGWHNVTRYSTDYAALPEMLKHLEARCYDISIFWSDTGPQRWHARAIHNSGDNSCHGDEPPEAVARLVVAVAEASK